MSFNTNIPGHVLIGDEDIVFGTAMLGDDFGEINKCDLERTGKQIEIENNRAGLRALIIANPGLALNLEATFDANVTPPGIGDPIAFPYAAVEGRVTEGAKIMWEAGGSRRLSFKAAYWDHLDNGSDAMDAYNVAADGTSTAIPGIAP